MKRLCFPAVCLLLLLPCGCANSLICANTGEVEDFDIVQTVGVDYENGMVVVTAATGTGPDGEITVLSSKAETMSRAMRQMQDYSYKKYIFFGHTQNLLIGEAAARQDISVYLEYVERGIDMRLDTKIYVVKGGTAEAAITSASEGGKSVNERLLSIEDDVRLLSEGYVFNCGEVAESIAEDGCAVIAAVESIENRRLLLGELPETVQMVGYALVRDGRLCRYLCGDDAYGLTLLLNKAEMDIAEVPDGAGGVASIEMTSASTSFDADFDAGVPLPVHVCVELRGNLAGLENPLDIYNDAVIRSLEEAFAATEAKRIERVLAVMQELRLDFIRIGQALEQKHPVRFPRFTDEIGGPWLDEAVLTFEIRAEIERTYDLGISPAQKETRKKK